MGASDGAMRLIGEDFISRYGAVEAGEGGVLRFEYRSVPMRVVFDETKHREPDMLIEVAEGPSPERMACRVYGIIMPSWQKPWSDDDRAGFWAETDAILESLADDVADLERLTAEASRDVAGFLDSIRVRYVVDESGRYLFEWDSVPLTFELHRNPGTTYLVVSTHWGREGYMIAWAEQYVSIPIDRNKLVGHMDQLARTSRTQADMTRRWFE